MLFIGKPRGRSMMIFNATNPLKESRKESLLSVHLQAEGVGQGK